MSGDIKLTRDAIVAAIKAALPDLYTCEAHGGRFDLNELTRWSRKAPAVLVAAVSVPAISDGPTNNAEVRWVAYLITRDTPEATRDVAALDFSEALLRLVRKNTWQLDNTQNPQRVAAENLYSGQIDRHGIALWAVSWQQAVSLRASDIAELADFTLYTATHEVGDGPVAEDRVELPQE